MTDYYIDGAVGNDANAGTSEGSGNAWKTIGHAATVAVSGDKVYIKGSATYTEDVTFTALGATTTPIEYDGYTSTPGDRGRISWVAATTFCWNHAGNNIYHAFYNIEYTGATYCIDALNPDAVLHFNCLFQNSSSQGIRSDNNWIFINCEFLNTGGLGCDVDSSCKAYFCKAQGCGNVSLWSLDWFDFVGNVIIQDSATTHDCVVGDVQRGLFNTLYVDIANHTQDGFGTAVNSHAMHIGNIFMRVDNGGALGAATNSSSVLSFANLTVLHNYSYNWQNLYNVTHTNGVQWDCDSTIDPEFVDPTSPTYDFTLGATSALLDRGYSAGLL
jgi:hypothetical protein